jgi:hypothetical protein
MFFSWDHLYFFFLVFRFFLILEIDWVFLLLFYCCWKFLFEDIYEFFLFFELKLLLIFIKFFLIFSNLNIFLCAKLVIYKLFIINNFFTKNLVKFNFNINLNSFIKFLKCKFYKIFSKTFFLPNLVFFFIEFFDLELRFGVTTYNENLTINNFMIQWFKYMPYLIFKKLNYKQILNEFYLYFYMYKNFFFYYLKKFKIYLNIFYFDWLYFFDFNFLKEDFYTVLGVVKNFDKYFLNGYLFIFKIFFNLMFYFYFFLINLYFISTLNILFNVLKNKYIYKFEIIYKYIYLMNLKIINENFINILKFYKILSILIYLVLKIISNFKIYLFFFFLKFWLNWIFLIFDSFF